MLPRGGTPSAQPLPRLNGVVEEYISANRHTWRHPKTEASWRSTLERFVLREMGDKRIDRVSRSDVLDVLKPLYTTKPSVARNVRHRLRSIFRYAQAHEWIESNPAGEVIDGALPRLPTAKHFEALHYRDVPGLMKDIEDDQSSAAMCLRFLTLTAARSIEARGATWAEIDLDARTWTIPGDRMKAGAEHRVPLSDQALDVLRQARQGQLRARVPVEARGNDPRHDRIEVRQDSESDGDRPRATHDVQDLEHGADGHPLGSLRDGARP